MKPSDRDYRIRLRIDTVQLTFHRCSHPNRAIVDDHSGTVKRQRNCCLHRAILDTVTRQRCKAFLIGNHPQRTLAYPDATLAGEHLGRYRRYDPVRPRIDLEDEIGTNIGNPNGVLSYGDASVAPYSTF